MKKLNFIYVLLLCSAFAACKKDNVKEEPTTPKTPVIAAVSDSISYTIDGKTYTAGGSALATTNNGGQDANRTLSFPDPKNKGAWMLAGNPDSILCYQTSVIAAQTGTMKVTFLKRFLKTSKFVIFYPPLDDALSLFAVGKHPLAEDFEWQNAHDGVAIDVVANNKAYSSYNAYDGPGTIVVPPGFQNGSTFEILSLVETTVGGYNLEAKFTAVVIDPTTGEKKQLDNGYLRLSFSPAYALPK